MVGAVGYGKVTVQNTLGLDDDLDGVELVKTLRTAFGVPFWDKDSMACYTVGDIYRVLLSDFSLGQTAGQGCASAMAFYRIRRACSDIGISKKISPETALSDLVNGSPRSFFGAINSRSGLDLPKLSAGPLGIAGGMIVGLSVLASLIFLFAQHAIPIWPLCFLLEGFLIHRADHKRFPKNLCSIGDLSKAAASLNFGKLVLAGARPREKDVWEALTEILAMNSSLLKAEIRHETMLLQSQIRGV